MIVINRMIPSHTKNGHPSTVFVVYVTSIGWLSSARLIIITVSVLIVVVVVVVVVVVLIIVVEVVVFILIVVPIFTCC